MTWLSQLTLSSPAAAAAGAPLATTPLLSTGTGALVGAVTVALQPGHKGLHGAEEEAATARTPGFDGATLLDLDDRAGITLGPLPILLPLRVTAPTPAELAALLHDLRDALNPRLWGPARLTAAFADGTSWSLDFTHEASEDDWAPARLNATRAVVFVRGVAWDPLAYGDEQTITYQLPVSGGMFPLEFPWELAAGDIVATPTPTTVAGSELAWPVVTLTGPASKLTARRLGRAGGPDLAYTVEAPLAAGQTLIVRHNPRQPRRVLRVDGPAGPGAGATRASWFRHLTPGWRLWPLRPGVEGLGFAAQNAAAGQTALAVSWRPARRYLT